MRPNIKYILKLMKNRNWKQSDLARAMKVSRATVCRLFKGSRGAGSQVILGLLIAFPEEKFENLFFLNQVSTNGNTELIKKEKQPA